ncbi:hypothetical protein BDR22DRAFT_894747 [Usnea florida]
MIVASADSSYWTTATVIEATMGIRFAASHQPWINLHFVFLELCSRPGYAEMLLQEVQSITILNFEATNSLLTLDSFIKEVVRVNPLDNSDVQFAAKPLDRLHSPTVGLMISRSGDSDLSPGRWHYAFVIRLALIQLVNAYELRLSDEPSSYKWFWETCLMPYESSRALIMRRQARKSTSVYSTVTGS